MGQPTTVCPSDGRWIELFRFDRKTTKGATCDNNTVQLSRSIGNDFLFFLSCPRGVPLCDMMKDDVDGRDAESEKQKPSERTRPPDYLRDLPLVLAPLEPLDATQNTTKRSRRQGPLFFLLLVRHCKQNVSHKSLAVC